MRQRRLHGRRLLCLSALGMTYTLFGSAVKAETKAQNPPEKLVASVNGDDITEAEFFLRLQRVHAQDFFVSVNPLTLRNESAGQLILNSLINERLILQWAEKTKQLPTDAEVDAEMANLKKGPEVAKALEEKFITEAALRRDVIIQRARFNLATTSASVSPQEVEAWYKAHVANYTTPERWGLALIRTSKQENVAKIQDDLKAGKPFADLAKTYSEDEKSKAQGGMLGMVASNDASLPASLKEMIKKLKVGEVTPPLKFDVNAGADKPAGSVWVFVRLLSREPGTVRPFDQVKEQVERLALLEKAGGLQVADKKIATYREQAKIQIFLPAYQALLAKPK